MRFIADRSNRNVASGVRECPISRVPHRFLLLRSASPITPISDVRFSCFVLPLDDPIHSQSSVNIDSNALGSEVFPHILT